jgi:hypothetical protein
MSTFFQKSFASMCHLIFLVHTLHELICVQPISSLDLIIISLLLNFLSLQSTWSICDPRGNLIHTWSKRHCITVQDFSEHDFSNSVAWRYHPCFFWFDDTIEALLWREVEHLPYLFCLLWTLIAFIVCVLNWNCISCSYF